MYEACRNVLICDLVHATKSYEFYIMLLPLFELYLLTNSLKVGPCNHSYKKKNDHVVIYRSKDI